jgi:hypothetical protein
MTANQPTIVAASPGPRLLDMPPEIMGLILSKVGTKALLEVTLLACYLLLSYHKFAARSEQLHCWELSKIYEINTWMCT